MSDIKNIHTLHGFIQKAFPGAYRYKLKDWNKLIADKFISFDRIVSDGQFRPEKCHVISGEKDKQINIDILKEKCEQAGINNQILGDVGHLSFHKDAQSTNLLLRKLLKTITS
jgi:hypothetical protein